MGESKEELLDQLISESENEADEIRGEQRKKGIVTTALGVLGIIFTAVYFFKSGGRMMFNRELFFIGSVVVTSFSMMIFGPFLIIKSVQKENIPE